jgi:RHS repeat-associated protein
VIGAEETVYVDQMYEVSSASDNPVATINVYLGETRLVSKLANLNDPNATTESRNTFYYHADQLGNSSLITDYAGEEYERMSFTPHGEVWQHSSRDTLNRIDLLFTGKGLDQETGWYYFGARYLDPKTGLWLSGDPAMEEYIPRAPLTDEDKKANKDLPGMGGVYNPMNLATYHYAGNNPVRYIDPDGRAQNKFQKALTSFFSFVASCGDAAAAIIQNNTNVDITRNYYEGIVIESDERRYYEDNLSVEVFGIPLNNIQVQSTPDHPSGGDTIPNGTKAKADVGVSGATQKFIRDTLLFDDLADFLHQKKPGTIRPGSKGCPITRTEAEVREVMDILRNNLRIENGEEKVNYSVKDNHWLLKIFRKENMDE